MENIMTSQKKVTRPALRYFGGKFRLSKWIIAQFPEHTTYVEPFGGAMGVLLNKQPAMFEVYNDLDSEVVNFFRVLREQPGELIRMIELTPFSREEQLLGFQSTENLDPVERARRLYTRCWQSHGGGRTQWVSGWRYQINNTRGRSVLTDWNQTDHLQAVIERLKSVQIEHDDATKVMRRFDKPDVLFYLDPPYLPSTRPVRWNKKAYMHEMTEEQHEEMLSVATSMQGMVVLSGKPSALYEQYLSGWLRLQKTVPTDFNCKTVECLWLSSTLISRQSQMRMKGI